MLQLALGICPWRSMRASGTNSGAAGGVAPRSFRPRCAEVDLSTALELEQAGLANQAALSAGTTKVFDRQPPLRRRRDHREESRDSLQRHRQRAGNRRCGQVSTSTSRRQRTSAALSATPKPVFSSMITSPEPPEADVGATAACGCSIAMSMRDRPALEDLGASRVERKRDSSPIVTATARSGRRNVCTCCSAAAVVGHKDGDLPAAGHRETPPASPPRSCEPRRRTQAVHRKPAAHVLQHGVDGRALIRRFLEVESLGEGLVVALRELERVPSRAARAAYRFSSSAAVSRTWRPRGAAPGPIRRRPAHAAAQRPDRRRCNARSGATARPARTAWPRSRIAGGRNSVGPSPRSSALQSQVAPDSVLDVHDRIAGTQLGQVAHEPPSTLVARSRCVRRLAARIGRIQLGLGHHGQSRRRRGESLVQRRRSQHQPRVEPAKSSKRSQSAKGSRDSDSICDIVSRRPGESATSSTRPAKLFRTIRAAAGRDRRSCGRTASAGKGTESPGDRIQTARGGPNGLSCRNSSSADRYSFPGARQGGCVSRQEGVALAGLVPEAPHGSPQPDHAARCGTRAAD